MKKNRFISFLICLLFCFSLSNNVSATETTGAQDTTVPTETTAPTETTPLPEIQAGDASILNGCRGLDAQVPMRSDNILDTGSAALLFEVESETLMYAKNIDNREYPGGFVKLMTCIVALEHGSLSDMVRVTEEMYNQIPRGSMTLNYPLQAGETLSLEDLLYAVMIHSANDAAVVVAIHIAGTQDAFVELMNQKAAEIGCKDTHYTNVHGIHDDEQYTTTRDLARIVAYGIQNKDFYALITTEMYHMADTELTPSGNRRLFSSNYMMGMMIMEDYYDYRVIGGKTATNKDNQRSAIILARDNGLYYIGIVMDTTPVRNLDGKIKTYNEFIEMDKLLDIGFQNYQVSQILYEGQITSRFSVTNGENSVAVGPTKSVMSVLPADVSFDQLTLRFQRTGGTLNAPIEKGTTLDILQVWYGAVCIAQAELVAMNSSDVAVTQPNTGGNNFSQIDLEGLISVLAVLGAIVVIIAGFIGVLYVIRWVRKMRLRSRQRRRRSSRRRSR